MNPSFARPEASASRYFPCPGSADPAPGSAALRELSRPGSRAARLGRTTRAPVARLVWLGARAVAAEQCGRIPRANFWWSEVRRQLDRLPPHDPAWDAARRVSGAPDALTAADFRGHVVREVLLDTHLGFINAHAGRDRARQAFHWDRARDLIRDAGLSDAEAAELELQWAARDLNDAIDDQGAFDRLDALSRQYPGSRRLHRMKVDFCRRVAGDAADRPERIAWAERLIALEPGDVRGRNLLRRLYRDAVREEVADDRWVEAAERAAEFARAYPDVRAPEADIDHLLRRSVRSALARRDEPTAVTAAERLRDRHPDDPDTPARFRSVAWAAVRGSCAAQDWSEAAQLLGQALPQFDAADRATAARLRGALAARALDAVPRDYDEGLRALETALERFPHEPDLHRSAVDQILARVRQRAEDVAQRSGDPESSATARAKAEVSNRGINLLKRQFDRNPALAAAAEGLASLYFSRAVQLANGTRPSDSLLDLEHVAAYEPEYEGLAQARSQVEELLRGVKHMVAELHASSGPQHVGGHVYRSVLNAEGEAVSAQAHKGTDPRDAFVRSGDVQQIRRRVREARALRYWLRAGLPPAGGWVARALAFDAATDLLAAKKPASAAELATGWLEVLSRRPDLVGELDGVRPEHLVAVFSRKTEEDAPPPDPEALIPDTDLAWLDQPAAFGGEVEFEPEPAEDIAAPGQDGSLGPVPLLPVASGAAHSTEEDVPPEFWLFSRRGPKVKAALVAASAFLLLAAGVAVTDARRQGQRDRAYAAARDALARGDETAARDATARLTAVRPLLPTRRTREQDAAAAELAGDLARLDRERARDAAVGRLLAGVKARDAAGTKVGADAFRKASWPSEPDPRQGFVEQADRWATELPALARRDAAFARLGAATEAGDDRTVVAAGIDFLKARTGLIDNRTDRTIVAGRHAVRRWALTTPEPLTPTDQQLVTAFLELTPRK